LNNIITSVIRQRTMRKIILSRPVDKTIKKAVATLFEQNGELAIQIETFHADGKATHRNLPADEAPAQLEALIRESYRQADILTNGGSCTVMVSKSGSVHIKNNITEAAPVKIAFHNQEKNHILADESSRPFLQFLGIADANGRILDRRRAKYRQINRFLELLRDVENQLPAEDPLLVCDLCCGKSYLTFAVYWYLTHVLGRKVEMYGVDLKADVITYCTECAGKLGWTGLHFLCENALDFTPPGKVDLMISLHACDIATDIVMACAVKADTKILMSTPCCHHEMSGQLECDALSFITDQPILRQKLCDAATDALRALRLECENYEVTSMELVDPDETPKNVLLRCVKRSAPLPGGRQEALRAKYDAACALLHCQPYLDKLLQG